MNDANTDIPLRRRHVILNARCSCLHGGPRGFRDRDHRIHSSGNYRDPPPPDEHAGLHRWMRRRAGPKVALDADAWRTVADALRDHLSREGRRVLAAAAGAVHVHLLAELPDDRRRCKFEVGLAKRFATERLKHSIDGPLWAAGGTFKLIRDAAHQREAFLYVTRKQRPAWVWDLRQGGRMVR